MGLCADRSLFPSPSRIFLFSDKGLSHVRSSQNKYGSLKVLYMQ